MRELVVDSFAGGGGASLGIARALGRGPDVAINHDRAAIAMHAANHPETRHYTEDVFRVSPRGVTRGRPVGLLWASPDCRHFSRAKGGKPVEKRIRGLAWVVVKWAVEAGPRVIILENVREFQDWGPLVPQWRCGCGWKGTEGQAALARTRRRCPRCDGRRLVETAAMVPDPGRKGLTFRRFVGRLKNLGYAVEWKVLNAADYGAPTHRRRLFLVARNDGLPIAWPEPTHGDPRKCGEPSLFAPLRPWRTAAECIDWSVPCPSIFDRKKPLAEKTLRRIALGIKRYVLDNPRPFLVSYYGDRSADGTPTDAPHPTITAQPKHALVMPHVAHLAHGEGKSGPNEVRASGCDEPLRTIHAGGGNFALVAPLLTRLGQTGGNGGYANPVTDPLTTVTSKAEHLVVAPLLVPRYGERDGQEPRAGTVEAPFPTVTPRANGGTLIAAFLAKHFGGVVGVPADTPLPTTTARGTQTQVVAANLVHLNHGEKTASGCDDPMRTVTAGGTHAALVYSFLVRYFGTAVGQPADAPLFTATGKARFGLVAVTIGGQDYVITDIGMRMLRPRELARAQGFGDGYVLTGTITNQVERIGNSVPPDVVEHLVRANYTPAPAMAAV